VIDRRHAPAWRLAKPGTRLARKLRSKSRQLVRLAGADGRTNRCRVAHFPAFPTPEQSAQSGLAGNRAHRFVDAKALPQEWTQHRLIPT